MSEPIEAVIRRLTGGGWISADVLSMRDGEIAFELAADAESIDSATLLEIDLPALIAFAVVIRRSGKRILANIERTADKGLLHNIQDSLQINSNEAR